MPITHQTNADGSFSPQGKTAWEEAHTLPDSSEIDFAQSGSGASARTVQNKAREIFSVKDFGCVGDGTTDDAANFQACIDAAEAASKARILVPSGIYSCSVQATDTVDGTSIRRCLEIAGNDIELYLEAGAVVKIADSQASGTQNINLIRIGSTAGGTFSRIRIAGPGRLDGNKDNQTSTPAVITRSAVVYAYGTLTDIDIDGVEIVEGLADAVYLEGVDTSNRLRRARVRNCRIDDCAEGVVWSDANYVRVERNNITNMASQDAIEPASPSSYWWILDNYIETVGSGNSGIDIFSGTTHGVCKGNILIDCGIDVARGGSAAVSDIVVADNNVTGANGRISVGVGHSSTVARVTVTGNIVSNTTASQTGMEIGKCTGVVITGNTVHTCGGRGIYLNSSNVVSPTVTGNLVMNNGQTGTVGATAGIQVNAPTNATIVGNTVIDTQGTATQGAGGGIVIQNAVDAMVFGNMIDGNTSDIIDYQATTTCRVGYNKGHVTENSGTATVPNGATAVSVTHGISHPNVTLNARDIKVTPTNNMGNATKFWISSVGTTTFNLNLDADPGAGTATFVWSVSRLSTAS